MLQRHVCIGLICALALSIAAVAGAQQVPQPVVRMGNSIELGDDVWVNFIGQGDIRFQFMHNRDFEGDIQDRVTTRDNTGTSNHAGTADIWYMEARLGADMQYKKHLKFRILFENQMTWDGNRIDNGFDLGGTNTDFPGLNVNCEGEIATTNCLQRNTTNLERLWIDYTLHNTPLRFRIGADLWYTDPARVIGDDDPRAAVFATFGNLELSAFIAMQTTAMRAGLTNDNNDMHYNFGAKYDLKPFRFAVDVTYFRWRFDQFQDIDTWSIRPSAIGTVGPVSFLVQPMMVLGNVDSKETGASYDVNGYAFIGQVEAKLGKITPFLAMVWGSGDGDATDDDLGAFSPLPQGEITLTTGSPYFSVLTSSSSWGARDVMPPAALNLGTGFEFLHTVGNPFSDRMGNGLIDGIDTTYNNPGVLTVAPGVKFAVAKGHQVDAYYIYRRVMESDAIEQELFNRYGENISVDSTMTHEIGAVYSWTPSPWFDMRLTGLAIIPGEGVKDIASAQICDQVTGERCKGEDVALHGEIRFRARF